jgi:uncharacterized protein with GYD domain
MDTYVIHVRLNSGVDPTEANTQVQNVVGAIDALESVNVEVYYAVQHASYDYVVIIDASSPTAAYAEAVALAMGGVAKTSIAPAMTADAYGSVLVNPLGIRG